MKNVAEIQWKQVPGYEGIYSISSDGVLKMDAKCKKWGGVKRTGAKNSDGYLRVSMTKDGRRRKWFVHRIVALAFIGPLPVGMEVNHIDGVKTNNHYSNLEYVTHRRNMKHAEAEGLWSPSNGAGFESPATKVTPESLKEIRSLKGKVTATEAGDRVGVSRSLVGNIWRGESWVE